MPGWQNTPEKRAKDAKVYGPAWRKARERQLERDGRICQLRYPGICTYRATEVDHIYGAANDPDHRHLRSACSPCHAHRTATEQSGGAQRARRITDPDPQPRTQW